MNELWPFVQPLFQQYWRMTLLGLLLTLLTSVSGISLLALSGWFVATAGMAGMVQASLSGGFSFLGFRTFALFRIVGRYVDLMVSHHVIFSVLADLRVWVYQRCIPLAPFHLASFRSSDLLHRMITDISILDGLYLRLLLPLLSSSVIAALAIWFYFTSLFYFMFIFYSGLRNKLYYFASGHSSRESFYWTTFG